MSDDGPDRKTVWIASVGAVVLGIVSAIAGAIALGNVIFGAVGGALGAGIAYKALEVGLS